MQQLGGTQTVGLQTDAVRSTISGVRKVPQTSGGATGLDELQLRIDQLEVELERYRSQEQLLAKTLVSATSYGTVIRENARREAELALRKARGEAERLKVRAERERDDARRELLRLRRITEQMRNGLSEFLMAKVDELQVEIDDHQSRQEDDELETALGSALGGQSAAKTRSGPEAASHPHLDVLARRGDDSTGGSPHAQR
jgi:cell division septum initiation protein DivIVA